MSLHMNRGQDHDRFEKDHQADSSICPHKSYIPAVLHLAFDARGTPIMCDLITIDGDCAHDPPLATHINIVRLPPSINFSAFRFAQPKHTTPAAFINPFQLSNSITMARSRAQKAPAKPHPNIDTQWRATTRAMSRGLKCKPFLELPAEIREIIYGYALGKIGHQRGRQQTSPSHRVVREVVQRDL